MKKQQEAAKISEEKRGEARRSEEKRGAARPKKNLSTLSMRPSSIMCASDMSGGGSSSKPTKSLI